MNRNPRQRIIKTPVFLAGEGKSEKGYGTWLARLANELSVPIAIRVEKLSGGDPLALVEQAIDKLEHAEKYRGRYIIRGLLLDEDRKGQDRNRDEKAEQKARLKRIHLIWQRPDHEAFVLRHFPGCKNLRPSGKRSERELLKVWEAYDKPMCAEEYSRMLTIEYLNRARAVEPDLDKFLSLIGWN